jgi:hypothetical protein
MIRVSRAAARPVVAALLALLLGAGAPGVNAQDSASPAIPDDAAELLGLSVAELFSRFGAPVSVFAVRGAESWQDDVVFSYSGGYSFMIYKDRVWQVRLAAGFKGTAFGFFVGDPVDKVVSLLGSPAFQLETTLVWNRPGRPWPVRVRVEIAAGRVSEIYVYRADF